MGDYSSVSPKAWPVKGEFDFRLETKVVLVTGGAGFMGSWLVDELVNRGHEVISADSLLGGKKRNVNPDCRFVRADLRRRSKISSIIKRVDVLFHLAAYAAEGQSLFSPISINDINITPMNNLLVECVNNNVQRFVFTSSMAVYGDQAPPFSEELNRLPVDPYGAAKAYCETMLEIFAKNYGLEFVIIRPHNVYGPRQNTSDPYRNVLGIWINQILRRKPPLIYGDGEQKRAFSYVDDITSSLADSGFSKKVNGEVLNLGSNEVVTINEACKLLLELMGSDFQPEYLPPRSGEVKNAFCTIEKSVKLLGYETRHPIRVGLQKMIEWARKVGPQRPTYTFPLEITKNAPKVWIERSI
jgi:UDP-glucose 4-epimerase